MPRPPFVICDADATIQFLLVRQILPLRLLVTKYAIQPLVTPAVELELRSQPKFARRISPELNKAFSNGILRVLDESVLQTHFGAPPAGTMAAKAAIAEISKLGNQYHGHVDRGEAYSHAAAIKLNVPILTNDRNALDVLTSTGLPVPSTALRAFDLLCLAFQVGAMPESDCDKFRDSLLLEKEHVPQCFRHAGFSRGLTRFTPRIIDSSFARVGQQPTTKQLPYSQTVTL